MFRGPIIVHKHGSDARVHSRSSAPPGSSVRGPWLVVEEVRRMSAHDDPAEDVNEVVLVGRMSRAAEEQILPSGDVMWRFRVIVPRRGEAARRAPVDALDCVVWAKRPARSVRSWRSGDIVEVRGCLRRRFFAAAGARVSRCEVEVRSARLIRRAAG
jgi:single-strand DNA-binding protein